MRIRRSKRIWVVVLVVFVAVFSFTFLTAKFKNNEDVGAANLGAFDPGYIISDYQMGNYNSMSEADIQAFLTAKNPCGNTNYNYYLQLSANKNYTWHWKDGHFVCLSEERFGDGEVIGSGETAAHIIWQAAQDYRINPQVLIVLLQKETGLITDPIPNNGDYRKATGYGCPDTAACSSKYYGFKNQVRNAAALFRTVLDGGWTNYPLGNNYIQYNPNSGCGGSWVNIRSLATSALYRYTPYQPNAAALSAGYGYGDGCSAYGNRNFYSYFEDWFGGITNTEDLIKELTYGGARTVEDGTYQIASQLSSEFVIDIEGGVTEDSSSGKIGLWTRKKDLSNAGNQLFDVKYDDNTGFYTIINSVSGLSLDVYNGNSVDGTEIIAWPQNSGCNQKWVINKYDDGYEISSACTGKVLDVPHSLAQRGQKVTIYRKKDSENQRWSFSVVPEEKFGGKYNIVARGDSNLVLDISGGIKEGMKSGSAIVYTKKGSNNLNQIFKFKRDNESEYYFIYNPYSNLYLDVYGGYMTDETKIIFWPYNGACNQKWKLESEEDYYYISSSCSDKVIDIRGGNLINKTDLIIYHKHDSYNQQWLIKEI